MTERGSDLYFKGAKIEGGDFMTEGHGQLKFSEAPCASCGAGMCITTPIKQDGEIWVFDRDHIILTCLACGLTIKENAK